MKGEIKKILHERGFGFINVEEEDDDAYFHWSDVNSMFDFHYIQEGDHVEFEIEKTKKGPQAKDVKIVF